MKFSWPSGPGSGTDKDIGETLVRSGSKTFNMTMQLLYYTGIAEIKDVAVFMSMHIKETLRRHRHNLNHDNPHHRRHHRRRHHRRRRHRHCRYK